MVADEEQLFRRIQYDWVGYDHGNLRLSSQAFADRGLKPSVNRALLQPDPNACKFQDTDGVAQLITEEVRRIDSVMVNPLAPVVQQLPYRLDVIERPIHAGNPDDEPENLAHAQIECDPNLESRSRFDKVKDALARLAESRPLVIEPEMPAI